MDNSIFIIFILLIFSFYIIYNNCISKIKEGFIVLPNLSDSLIKLYRNLNIGQLSDKCKMVNKIITSGNYNSNSRTVITPVECQKECNKDRNCKFFNFTYMRNKNNCILKNNNHIVKDANYLSTPYNDLFYGIKNCNPNKMVTYFDRIRNNIKKKEKEKQVEEIIRLENEQNKVQRNKTDMYNLYNGPNYRYLDLLFFKKILESKNENINNTKYIEFLHYIKHSSNRDARYFRINDNIFLKYFNMNPNNFIEFSNLVVSNMNNYPELGTNLEKENFLDNTIRVFKDRFQNYLRRINKI